MNGGQTDPEAEGRLLLETERQEGETSSAFAVLPCADPTVRPSSKARAVRTNNDDRQWEHRRPLQYYVVWDNRYIEVPPIGNALDFHFSTAPANDDDNRRRRLVLL
jgi:hypothetical protein